MLENYKELDLLFEGLNKLTGVRDIAYHRFGEGRINPVLKTNTDILGVEKWKNAHANNPVYIQHDQLLSDICREPRTLVVQDVKNDPRSADEFFLFGIDSIMIIPVLVQDDLKGIVVVASIGELHFFDDEEIEKSEQIVEQYINIF